jgi:hypothetical protein
MIVPSHIAQPLALEPTTLGKRFEPPGHQLAPSSPPHLSTLANERLIRLRNHLAPAQIGDVCLLLHEKGSLKVVYCY